MTIRHKLAAVAFCCLFLAPNVWALCHPYEDWPYTSLPMYAHYVGPQTPRFKFMFIAQLEDGREEELSSYAIGIDYALMRYFLKYVYGSVEPPPSPFTLYPGDNAAAFTQRVGRFFSVFSREYQQRHPTHTVRGIRLQVGRLRWEDNAITDVHSVGRYDVGSARFEHTWRVER